MDSFKEQIVRKIPTKNDKIQKIFIMIASVALAHCALSSLSVRSFL